MAVVIIKNVDIINNVMLTYSEAKFMDVLLCVLYTVMCVQTSSIKVFGARDHVPMPCIDVSPT